MKRDFRDSDSEDEGEILSGSSQPVAVARKKRRGVIEKRRRDRINNSLSELRRMVPTAYEKQGSAKLEKAEILQLTVEHLKMLQNVMAKGMPFNDAHAIALDYRSVGYRECVSEVARYLIAIEGMGSHNPLHIRLLNHLHNMVKQSEITHPLKHGIQAGFPTWIDFTAQAGTRNLQNPETNFPLGFIRHKPQPLSSVLSYARSISTKDVKLDFVSEIMAAKIEGTKLSNLPHTHSSSNEALSGQLWANRTTLSDSGELTPTRPFLQTVPAFGRGKNNLQLPNSEAAGHLFALSSASHNKVNNHTVGKANCGKSDPAVAFLT